jgi:glutamyl-tRNA synthetase
MVRTRIAPSPTGEDIHIGTLQTALINMTIARKNGGKFIIRIEDTDRQRFVKGAEEKFLNTLRSYRLKHDEGPDIGGEYAPYRQSERLTLYKKYAEELIEKGQAYYCFCTKERLEELRTNQLKDKKQTRYDKFCLLHVKNSQERIAKKEQYVVRLNVESDKKIVFEDVIRGQIVIESNEVDDQVLLKSDGFPTYHLAVVIDDYLMKITHVIRGEEWISSTPKHILLYEAFGWAKPIFAHTPLLRNPDKSKLSKRKNPVWASWYLAQGILPEAMINYLALLGWSHPQEKEIFTFQEFTELFDLKDIKPVGPVFDLKKLTWMNQQYIQMKSDAELRELILNFSPKAKDIPGDTLEKLIPLLKSRMENLSEFENLTAVFFGKTENAEYDEKEKELAIKLQQELAGISSWKSDNIFEVMKKLMGDYGVKMPVFYKLITGSTRGLPLPETIEILGKEKTLKKLDSV